MKREDCYGEYAAKLEGEYKEAYKTVNGMLSFMSGELNPLGTTMSEVVDLLLVAQEEDRPVSSVLGDDLYAFCCQILKGSKISIKEAVIQFFIRMRFLFMGALFFSISDMMFPVEGERILFPVIWICIFPVVSIFDYILLYVLRPLGKYVGKLGNLFSILKAIIYLVILWKWYDVSCENALVSQLSQFIPLKAEVATLTVLLCWILWICNRRKKKCAKDEDMKFSELVFTDELTETRFKSQQIAYAGYLKRCNKKGKVPKDIVLWYEHKLKIDAFLNKWAVILYASISIVIILLVTSFIEFESRADLIFWMVIQIIGQIFVAKYFIRFQRKIYLGSKEIQERMIETISQEQ